MASTHLRNAIRVLEQRGALDETVEFLEEDDEKIRIVENALADSEDREYLYPYLLAERARRVARNEWLKPEVGDDPDFPGFKKRKRP